MRSVSYTLKVLKCGCLFEIRAVYVYCFNVFFYCLQTLLYACLARFHLQRHHGVSNSTEAVLTSEGHVATMTLGHSGLSRILALLHVDAGYPYNASLYM